MPKTSFLSFLVLMMKKIELNGEVINNIQIQKLLGVHTDYKLKVDTHIETPCETEGKKLHALVRVIKYMSTNQPQMLLKFYNVAIQLLSTHLDVL